MMLQVKPYKESDAKEILSWCQNEIEFYKWTAGVMGNYPITEKEFDFVKTLMPFTVFDDSRIVGFFTLRKTNNSPDELRFGFVIVNPEFRNRGYGKEMLKQGLDYVFRTYGAKKASLGVFENNPAAYHCYKAVGFRDAIISKEVEYQILCEKWKCKEMIFENA